MTWIVCQTKPNSESIAKLNLDRQGYESYCPRILWKRPNKAPIVKPLFPCYIFVKIDLTWYSVRSTRGIRYVLINDTGPKILTDDVIENLKRREGSNGLVQLTPKDKFEIGSSVRTTSGPFAGHTMLYEGMSGTDRVKVLFDLLGRKCIVEVPEKLLVAA